MPIPERRDPAKERYWRRTLAQWQRSRLTGRDFCAAHGLSEPSFSAWRREIARRDQEQTPPANKAPRLTEPPPADFPAPAFLQVTLAAVAPAPSTIEVALAHGRLLRVGPGFDAELLRQLLRVLEEPAC